MSTRGQPEGVMDVLAVVSAWARRDERVRGVLLVGSHARGEAGTASDVDLCVVVDDSAPFVDDDAWVHAVWPAGSVLDTRCWGALTERRVGLSSGLEVDVGFVAPSWARTDPVDPGTARVVAGGATIVHDPDGLLAGLLERVPPATGRAVRAAALREAGAFRDAPATSG